MSDLTSNTTHFPYTTLFRSCASRMRVSFWPSAWKRIASVALATDAIRFHAEGQKRSEEHTSELQSRPHLVCRLLLVKKKTDNTIIISITSSLYIHYHLS